MTPELRALYHDVIVEHSKRPRNFRRLAGARVAEGYNPLCGDAVTVYVDVQDGSIRDVAFQGSGCAISTASASLMTEALKGKSEAAVAQLFERFHALATQGAPAAAAASLGTLAVFAGVSAYPSRVKCAVLAWQTLQAALRGESSVSTE